MSTPAVTGGRHPQPLANNASASAQFTRLLDALDVLEQERSCHIGELAARVGLQPGRLRELLTAYCVAGAEVLGPEAPSSIAFGTADGPLGTDEADDARQAAADTVHVGSSATSLSARLGSPAVEVADLARAVLAGTLLTEDGRLDDARREQVTELVRLLSAAMGATVETPAERTALVLSRAVREQRRVAFDFVHPWTLERSRCEVEPYDVRRARERLVLDAGPGLRTYDLVGISDVELLDTTFTAPALPPAEVRTPRTPVVLRVRTERQERWLCESWRGRVVGPAADGRIDIRIELDGGPSDAASADRLGALLLQMEEGVSVVSPPELVPAVARVAQRVLSRHR